MKRYVFATIVMILSAGCYADPQFKANMMAQLQVRASADLHCSEDELHVVETAPAIRHVEGCGHAQSYVAVCQYFQCRWVVGDEETARAIGAANAGRRRAFELINERRH